MRVPHVAALVLGASFAIPTPSAAAPLKFEFGLSGWPDKGCSVQEDYTPPNCAPTGIFARLNEEGVPMMFRIDGSLTFGGAPGQNRSHATITFDDGFQITLNGKGGSAHLSAQHLSESEHGPGMVTLAELHFDAAGLSGQFYLEEYYGTPQCPPHSVVKSRPAGEDTECSTEVANTIEELSFIDFGAPLDNLDTYAIVDGFGGSTGQIEMDYFRRVAVPEPATLALLALGGAAIAFGRRRSAV